MPVVLHSLYYTLEECFPFRLKLYLISLSDLASDLERCGKLWRGGLRVCILDFVHLQYILYVRSYIIYRLLQQQSRHAHCKTLSFRLCLLAIGSLSVLCRYLQSSLTSKFYVVPDVNRSVSVDVGRLYSLRPFPSESLRIYESTFMFWCKSVEIVLEFVDQNFYV